MRVLVVMTIGALVCCAAAACGGETVAAANGCSISGANAIINTTDTHFFVPDSVSFKAGGSVCWQNGGTVSHTVTSNDGISFNASLASGQVSLHIFPVAGSFPYHCNIHAGMIGIIKVQ